MKLVDFRINSPKDYLALLFKRCIIGRWNRLSDSWSSCTGVPAEILPYLGFLDDTVNERGWWEGSSADSVGGILAGGAWEALCKGLYANMISTLTSLFCLLISIAFFAGWTCSF